jgi:CHC2-type zinc finger protein
MQSFSSSYRSDRPGGQSSAFGATQTVDERKRALNALIQQADTVPLTTLFKHYGLRIDHYTNKLICPFLKHKNGQESTPSFKYYPDNNTFWCFGCQTGRTPTDFVAQMEGLSRPKAAHRILELYASEADDSIATVELPNYSERLQLLMEFSNFIREQMQANLDDPSMITHLESITFVFDKMIQKHTLDNEALQILITKLKGKV